MDDITLTAEGIDVFHYFVGRGYTKIFDIKRGATIGQHAHLKDHIAMLILGRVVIENTEVRGELTAPATVMIKAGDAHEISAIEDSVWACVWPDAEGATTAAEFDAKVTP
jgi:quercetin dioxygenase-like cupin family protein